jgi:hypothetical protein
MMQVVERRARAEGLFIVLLKHLVGKTTQNLIRDSPFAPCVGLEAWNGLMLREPLMCIVSNNGHNVS